ncbi:MAG TPA: DUF2189 domain-containing protein [Hyphomicrobiaceae bacterium]|nr:DUF2189 domain-containing protein [Hyphomicrobiaceae bacterium]
MAHTDVILPTEAGRELPGVRSITPMDLWDVLAKGVDDFRAMPTHAIFLSLIYPLAGLAVAYWTFGFNIVPLLYPLLAGFALIGPFAAVGLYELSRRREMGLDTSGRHAFDILHSPSLWSILALGLLLLALFGVWLGVAHGLYVSLFGVDERPITLVELWRRITTTPEGHRLLWTGNLVGALFALTSFALSVISFPLLLDRNVGMATAIVTSVRAILRNPLTMALWGLIVAVGLALGSLPFLFGLAVVMPILGHATWHLYRTVVTPDLASRRPELHRRPRGQRYAADFPSALFLPLMRDDRKE